MFAKFNHICSPHNECLILSLRRHSNPDEIFPATVRIKIQLVANAVLLGPDLYMYYYRCYCYVTMVIVVWWSGDGWVIG